MWHKDDIFKKIEGEAHKSLFGKVEDKFTERLNRIQNLNKNSKGSSCIKLVLT